MKTPLARKVLLLLALLMLPGVSSANCKGIDNIKVGYADWTSAKIHATIIVDTLLYGFGCSPDQVTYVEGDHPTLTKMLLAGELDIMPELWEDGFEKELETARDEERICTIGTSMTNAREGYFIDKVTAEKHELQHVDQLADPDIAALFKGENAEQSPSFLSCLEVWDCWAINEIKQKAYGLLDYFKSTIPESTDDFVNAIQSNLDDKQPVFTYYWLPSAMIGSNQLVQLQEPDHDSDDWLELETASKNFAETSQLPQSPVAASAYPSRDFKMEISARLEKQNRKITKFLSRYSLDAQVMSELMYQKKVGELYDSEVVTYFFKNYSDIWPHWLRRAEIKNIKREYGVN